jgi:hypothetical protein
MVAFGLKTGAEDGARTRNLLLGRQKLYQLSYLRRNFSIVYGRQVGVNGRKTDSFIYYSLYSFKLKVLANIPRSSDAVLIIPLYNRNRGFSTKPDKKSG